ncbi:hypothetical protein LJC26_06660 [Desulfovibrio sp. OttesenSCG-928-O18]|nr:hypothetical protein [Desulfovibrio sp. OttesenSCG-928-O18]
MATQGLPAQATDGNASEYLLISRKNADAVENGLYQALDITRAINFIVSQYVTGHAENEAPPDYLTTLGDVLEERLQGLEGITTVLNMKTLKEICLCNHRGGEAQ